MSQEVLARALEPFYTTKPMGKGTGLGLPIVFGTVKAHHGRMEICSEAGRGTQVKLLLPAHLDVPGRPSQETQQLSSPPVRMLNVLLVDDDELIQHAVHRILRSTGHAVTTVSGGRSALSAIEAGLRPDLVLLDMNMPELDGAATLPRLRELLPNVPVVLATGRADERAMELVASYAHVTLLPKPFNASELGTKVALVGRRAAES
jgi:CheY-like chemotaxis protein